MALKWQTILIVKDEIFSRLFLEFDNRALKSSHKTFSSSNFGSLTYLTFCDVNLCQNLLMSNRTGEPAPDRPAENFLRILTTVLTNLNRV